MWQIIARLFIRRVCGYLVNVDMSRSFESDYASPSCARICPVWCATRLFVTAAIWAQIDPPSAKSPLPCTCWAHDQDTATLRPCSLRPVCDWSGTSTSVKESKDWTQPVTFGQSSDTGKKFTVVVDFVHPQVREYVMEKLRKRMSIRFGTRQTGGQIETFQKAVRGTDTTVVETSASKELDNAEDEREVQQLRIVNDYLTAESEDSHPCQHRSLEEERGGSREEPQPNWEWNKTPDTKQETLRSPLSPTQKGTCEEHLDRRMNPDK